MADFAEGVKNGIEVHQYFPFGDLCNVIQAFGREVAYSVLGIGEAYQ